MKRTYLDSSVLIQAVQGVDGEKTARLLEDAEREFVAATFLKLELLPQPTFHKRKAELEFLQAFFERVTEWRQADEVLVTAALTEAKSVPLSAVDAIHVAAAKALMCDEFITAEKPGKPLHKVKNLKVRFLPSV
ncbi:MAG TPA: type II toxin-antitoxin system VapC family toxin [Verrucomicrobiae bacterium]|nr:type II toxin-antitoxin system VapC family toxin [Verrucomicrobiae bacterium]